MPEDDGRSRTGGTGVGVLLGFLLQVLQYPLAFFIGYLSSQFGSSDFGRGGYFGFVPLAFIGVSQLLYIIPAVLIAQARGRPGIARGLMIAAGVVFLLNSACFGMIFLKGF